MEKFQVTFKTNEAGAQTWDFADRHELTTFCASLIEKSKGGQDIIIQSFTGPMALGKYLFNELVPKYS